MAEKDPAARTSVALVRDVISTVLADSQINAFINTAHMMVETRLGSKNLDNALLTQIETWLSAHLLSARDQRKKQTKVGDMQVTYQGETGMGLQSTIYGQQVLVLDPTGTMATTSLKRAVIQVVGDK